MFLFVSVGFLVFFLGSKVPKLIYDDVFASVLSDFFNVPKH